MARDKHDNDMFIGDDQWIEWIDIGDKQSQAIDIDAIILRISELWDLLETWCVADCCGISAFSFIPEEIQQAAYSVGVDRISNEIRLMTEEIKALDGEILVSMRLNNYFHKAMFLQLLEHITQSLENGKPAD